MEGRKHTGSRGQRREGKGRKGERMWKGEVRRKEEERARQWRNGKDAKGEGKKRARW